MNLTGGSIRPRVVLGDITGMIDVVFLLIIFFLTTSTLVRLNASPVNLPELIGEQEQLDDDRPIIVNINADGSMIVDQRRMTPSELGSLIDIEADGDPDIASNLTVLVRADRLCSVEHVDAVARVLLDRGVMFWSLGTAVPSRQGSE